MKGKDHFINSWIRSDRTFRGYECRFIDGVSAELSKLSPKAKGLFDSQVAEINKIQRHARGKEVILYAKQGKKVYWREELLFPNRAECLVLARCKFEATKIESQLLITRGHLGVIEFDAFSVRLNDDKISSINVLGNPLDRLDRGIETAVYLDRIALPTDYSTTLNQYEQQVTPNVIVYSPVTMRRVLLDDENYCMLAQIPQRGAIVLKEYDQSGGLYWFSFEERDPRRLGKSLAAAIETARSFGVKK